MNKFLIIKIIAAIACVVMGSFLFTVSTDQEFSNVPPIDDAVPVLPMKAGTKYIQQFTTNRKTISRLGIYMRPLTKVRDANSNVTVSLQQGDSILASTSVPAIFIENGGPTYVRFENPIQTFKGEQLAILIQVPEGLTESIGLRLREKKGDFSATEIQLLVDNQEQKNFVAYNAFERVRPPIAKQVGAVLIGIGVAILCFKYIKKYQRISFAIVLLCISFLVAIPAIDASMPYVAFVGCSAVALFGMWIGLRTGGRSNLAALFGAALFACSSWLPLQFITYPSAGEILSVRDALMDPNQIAVSHANGGYIGIPGAVATGIGVMISLGFLVASRKNKRALDVAMLLVGLIVFLIAFIPSPLYSKYAIILVVSACSWFASLTIDSLQRLFGKQDSYATILLCILVTVSIMDLLYVSARTLLYGTGI